MKSSDLGATKQVRVVIISGQAISRAGLRLLIESRAGLTVAAEATCQREIQACADADVILADLELVEAPQSISELDGVMKAVPVIVLASERVADAPHRAIRLGARALVLKEQPPETLFRAIERVSAGEVWFDKSMIESLLGNTTRGDLEAAKIAALTAREREVVALIGEGLRNRQIADRLFISESTVRHHLRSIFEKLEVADRFELLIYAYKNGLAELPR